MLWNHYTFDPDDECNPDFSPTTYAITQEHFAKPFFCVITKHNAVAITLTFMALGYVGAAFSYIHLIGLNIDFRYLCPVCPEILSLGSPIEKFIRRTVALGTINAAGLAAVWWSLIGIVTSLNSFFSGRSR